jgi:hypothetical protein
MIHLIAVLFVIGVVLCLIGLLLTAIVAFDEHLREKYKREDELKRWTVLPGNPKDPMDVGRIAKPENHVYYDFLYNLRAGRKPEDEKKD